MSGPHVFCELGCTTRVRRESIARVVPLSSAVVCIESIPAYAGVVVPGLPILVYVWLSCRAVVLANYSTGGLGVAMISNVFQA